MLNIKSFPVILLLWVCLISWCMCVCVCVSVCVMAPQSRSVWVFISCRKWMCGGCWTSCFSLSSSSSSSSSSQLKHMMVMTGYPDFLLKPELIDQEYGVSHELPAPSSHPHHAPPPTHHIHPSHFPASLPPSLPVSVCRITFRQVLQCSLDDCVQLGEKKKEATSCTGSKRTQHTLMRLLK